MSHIHLTSADHIFTGVGADMRYNKPSHEYPMHDHEFHEIVYVADGNANHYINGKILPMTAGCLYFIRNTDIHTYSDFTGDSFTYYTLLLEKETVHGMFAYYGMEKAESELMARPLPPEVHLGRSECEQMDSRFSELFLMMHSDPQTFGTGSRLLLTELASKYFTEIPKDNNPVPLWLEYACERMRLPKNLTAGSERFFEICGRSREHCTRMMKKYYGISPVGYISDLRMQYAANLLTSSDLTVSEIALECGYASIPHFYALFSEKFGVSPGEYRDSSKSSI